MAEQRRIDPEDGYAYTWEEIYQHYLPIYRKKKVIETYWEQECTPVKAKAKTTAKSKAKSTPIGAVHTQAKAKAKVKAKAKAKMKTEARGPANAKRFVEADATIVQDAVDGLIWSTPGLCRLDAYPDIKVVFRTPGEWAKDKVSLVSGGGAGHEPMHGGFVGRGMLTAAISGETFASPTIDAVLSAIVQVTGPKGCLLVIKNYTGDRLNFTLAAQRARSQFGLKVETVIARDDVATVAARGIAGTLLVHKVAGAVAEAGGTLEEVRAAAEEVINASASMGVSFSSVRRLKPEGIPLRKMEIGLGIHGEPGARVEEMAPASKVVEVIMESVMASELMKPEAPDGYACLINNLGSVPPQEMSIITAALMKSKWGPSVKLLIGPAALCTSLDMNGVSLSLLRLTPKLTTSLTAETGVTMWPKAVVPEFPKPVEGIKGLDGMEGVSPSTDETVGATLSKICKALIDAKDALDALDAKVGDADCGSTMAAVASKVLGEKEKLPLADAQATCSCLSSVLGKVGGGSSGVLLSIMFMGMASSFAKSGKSTWQDRGAQAFMDGLQAMMDAGGAKKGSRTMLDAMVPAAEALLAGKGLAGAKDAAQTGMEDTKNIAPRAGRSENVPESAWKGVEDPGAKAVALVFAAIA